MCLVERASRRKRLLFVQETRFFPQHSPTSHAPPPSFPYQSAHLQSTLSALLLFMRYLLFLHESLPYSLPPYSFPRSSNSCIPLIPRPRPPSRPRSSPAPPHLSFRPHRPALRSPLPLRRIIPRRVPPPAPRLQDPLRISHVPYRVQSHTLHCVPFGATPPPTRA